jgi:hypothetical protein
VKFPVVTDITLTVSWTQDWVWNDSAVVYAWIWGGTYGSGKWVKCTKASSTSVKLNIDSSGCTAFLLTRCYKTTTTPSWSTNGDAAGRIYNKTSNISYTKGTTSYKTSSWKGRDE